MPPRHAVTSAQWAKIQPLLPKSKRGRPSRLGDRLFVDAVIWRAKTGCSWRDLHPRFGNWKTVYNRFRDWSQKGIWRGIVRELVMDKQEANSILDSSYIRAHQDSAGGRGGQKKTRSAGRKEELPQKSMLWSILEEIFED